MRWFATCVVLCLVSASCGETVDAPGAGAPGVPSATELDASTSTTATSTATAPATPPTTTSPPTTSVDAVDAAPTTTEGAVGEDAVEPRPTVLRRGDRGHWVVRLQEELRRHGYTIDADGTFGPATEEALRGFQYGHGLDVDGLAGPATWRALLHDEVIPAVDPPPRVAPLRADGLGTFDFGTPVEEMVGPLIAELGPPADDYSPSCYGDEPCSPGEQRISWRGSSGARFEVRFDDLGDGLRFTGWELTSWGGEGRFDLATASGITLGLSAAELSAEYPAIQYGFWPQPACGDTWWSPGQFRVDAGETGLRGSVAHDDPFGQLDQAIIDLGFPDGLSCGGDVMCSGVFRQVQATLGLPQSGTLDRETWTALDLPLPLDPAAPIQELRAGRLVNVC